MNLEKMIAYRIVWIGNGKGGDGNSREVFEELLLVLGALGGGLPQQRQGGAPGEDAHREAVRVLQQLPHQVLASGPCGPQHHRGERRPSSGRGLSSSRGNRGVG